MAKKQSEFVELYGREWARGTSRLGVELWAYRTSRTVAEGGLGREQHFRNAFKMQWPDFPMHTWMDMEISAFCNEKYTIVIGHTRASKTYGCAHIAYLDWLADTRNTWTSLTTVTFDGLRSRMWSDLLRAVETATVACPGRVQSTVNQMRIFMDEEGKKADMKYMIEGFATANTSDAAERIQGKHADRRRLFMDEAEGLPAAVFEAEPNAASAEDFRSMKLANPLDRLSIFGQQYEPVNGWSSISDSDLTWRGKSGAMVLHFDGLQCHNMKLWNTLAPEEYKKKAYKWMISPDYIEDIRKNHSEDSIAWWKFVRGFPPPDGMVNRVFPSIVLERSQPEKEFDLEPVKFCCMDPAYEHDDCVLQYGVFGNQRDGQIAVQFHESQKVPTKVGKNYDPKEYQIKDFVMQQCHARGIAPTHFIQDKTGNGRGVFALLQKEWSMDVRGVEFGGAPSERPIYIGNTDIPKDIYGYFVDELWFRAKAWCEAGLVGGLNNLHDYTMQDLGARIYTITKADKMRLMPKSDMKKITGRSPDYGDAFILFAELLAQMGIFVGGKMEVDGENMNFMYDDPASNNSWSATREKAHKIHSVMQDETFGH
jgi:hypothetical protein